MSSPPPSLSSSSTGDNTLSPSTSISSLGDTMSRTVDLPVEIWNMILDYVPASFFQKDLRRLTLSKQWYSLAHYSYYPRIDYTPRVISRLVNRKSKCLDKTRALLKQSMKSVNIVLQGIPPTPPCDENDPNIIFNTTANLPRFAMILLEFQKLEHLRFCADYANQAWKGDPFQENYLPLRSIDPYLNLLSSHVTSMDIDLCGTCVTGMARGRHFCGFLRPLLTKLVKLKVRLKSICAEALKPVDKNNATVKELMVDLYLGRISEYNPKLNCARLCSDDEAFRSWIDPIDEARMGLLGLVDKMENPVKVGMVHLDARSGEVHSWDALSDEMGTKCVRVWSENLFTEFWTLEGVRDGSSCFKEEAPRKLLEDWIPSDSNSGLANIWDEVGAHIPDADLGYWT